jgi:molybdopterin converting factor subunit 1
MRVTVQLFARLRELAGTERLDVHVPDGATVRDVWSQTARQHPSLAPYASAVSFAVNADFAKPSRVVHEGDDIAFLPPVSGG